MNMHAHAPLPFGAYTEDDEQLIAEFYAAEARENLWAFRKYMDPKMTLGWWPRMVSNELQSFYTRLKNGHRPKLLLMAPPQHGKSRGVQDFLAWVHGHEPDWKSIFASFSADLGTATNSVLQRMFDEERYRIAFPDTQISPLSGGGDLSGRYNRNSSLLEFVERAGSFRNTTVNGQINGKTLNLGVVDDPIKGRAEASSPPMRDKAWNWLMDDFLSRFTDDAGMIMTMTRWHLDDPGGRFLERFPSTKVLRFPAYATEQSIRDNREPRKIGEPLFPQFKSFAFLEERRVASIASSWMSLYQQTPIVAGGGLFPIEKFKIVGSFSRKEIKKSVRYWDKAGTLDGGAYTAGVLMHQMDSGCVLIENIVRGQWDHYTREQRIRQTGEIDAANQRTEIWVEQEPGSGGLESAERTISNLKGLLAFKDKVTGAKEIRAEPYAAQVQGGNVELLRSLGPTGWNKPFLDEHESFPSGKYKDQVDAAAGAFMKLVQKKYAYDTSLKWV